MREIKFRGRMTTGKWVYGDLRHDLKGSTRYYEECPYRICWREGNAEHNAPVVKGTVGQYTGLKDKHGQEIYEGDVLKTDLSRPYVVVVFRNGSFMYQCHDSGRDYYDFMLPSESEEKLDKYLEVIGNIREHPELLGSQ